MPTNRIVIALATYLSLGCMFAHADIVPFDFVGKVGSGLRPVNTVGPFSADGMPSNAIGDESGGGIYFDTNTNILHFEFTFSGLTDGLRDNGVHFHVGSDRFPNGPIEFNLNGGSSADVSDEVTSTSTPTDMTLENFAAVW